jgi:hypothetical protein
MALDPVDPTIVYAATGEGNGGLSGCGVLRSGDGGNTWTTGFTGLRSTAGAGGPFLSLIVDPATAGSASSSILLGATLFTNAGIVRSVNSGASWTPVLNTGPASSIIAHPTKPGTFYAGNRVTTPASARGVYRSTDVGLSWSQLPPLPVDANSIGRVEVAISKAAPGIVWALVGDRSTGGFLGLFKFDEATSTWTQLGADGVTSSFGGQQTYDLVLAVDPVNPQRVYIAGVGAFRSLDGGATFKRMAVDVHVDWHVIVFDPNDPTILWAGTDGGVYLSTDGGDSWSSRSAGLAITQFYPGIAVHPQGTRISGGSQDNGTHVFTGTPFWDAFIGGDGGYTAINYANPNVHWGETQWSGSTVGNLFRQDGVAATQRRSSGITLTDRAQFIPPLVMDPVNPAKLYFGTFRLYQTTNEGVNWTALGGDLSNGTGTITSISVSPADTMTIYAGTSDGRALVSRDGGVTFTAATGLPNRFVTRVMAHPTDPLRALITVSGCLRRPRSRHYRELDRRAGERGDLHADPRCDGHRDRCGNLPIGRQRDFVVRRSVGNAERDRLRSRLPAGDRSPRRGHLRPRNVRLRRRHADGPSRRRKRRRQDRRIRRAAHPTGARRIAPAVHHDLSAGRRELQRFDRRRRRRSRVARSRWVADYRCVRGDEQVVIVALGRWITTMRHPESRTISTIGYGQNNRD